MRPLTLSLMLAGAVLWGPGQASGEEEAPLPEQQLHCADSPEQAERALGLLAVDARQGLELPSQVVDGVTYVKAERVDRVLRELGMAYHRFPGLQAKIEGVVLSWSYCDVLFGGDTWDLMVTDRGIERIRVQAPPGGFRGFAAWGLLEGSERIVPRLLEENGLGRGQREWFVSDVVHERCFPHPVSGRTPFTDPGGFSKGTGVRSKPSESAPKSFAYQVEEVCPKRKGPEAVAGVRGPQGSGAPATTQPAEVPPGPPLSAGQGAPGDALTTSSTATGHYGLSGSVYESLALSGRATVGVRAGYAPFSGGYIRAGLVQRVARSGDLPTYSWGIGYNDWHTGTFSVELNNWGPIPIDKLDIKGAMVDVGYKIPLRGVVATYLGLGVGINYPLNATPGAGVSVNVKAFRDWFVSAGVRWYPWADMRFTWTYGFGNWSWRPYTFSLAYNNWGPNAAFVPNFERNGTITLAWSWAL